MKLTLSRKVLVLIAIPFLIQCAFLFNYAKLLDDAEFAAKQEQGSKELFTHTNWLTVLLMTSTLAALSYVLTKDREYIQIYDFAQARVAGEIAGLAALFKGDKKGQVSIKALQDYSQKLLAVLTELVENKQSKVNLAYFQDMSSTKMKEIWSGLSIARHGLLVEGQIKFGLTASSLPQTREGMRRLLSIGILLNVFSLFVLIYFYSTDISKRLRILTDNSSRLAKGKELNPPLSGSDEIADLDLTFHKMANALARARLKERAVLDNMMVGLITFDPSGKIESVNPRIETIFHYKSEELLGHKLDKLFLQEPASQNTNISSVSFSHRLEQILQLKSGKILEIDALRKNGEIFPIELSTNEFQTEEGLRYLANILDVSERKEIERLKSQFVATVSHELRTPLTSIRGALTLLTAGALGELPEPIKHLVIIAERNTLRLINLINDILDIEKFESGNMKMQFARANIADIIERSVESVRIFAEQQQITLLQESTVESVYLDEERIVQVLVNLLSNAIKFSPCQSKVLVICREKNGMVEFRVKDEGRGVPEEYRELIFQRFQQIESSDARKKGGTGLGLAICKQIIESHGGSIGVDSAKDQGSNFWFLIPK